MGGIRGGYNGGEGAAQRRMHETQAPPPPAADASRPQLTFAQTWHGRGAQVLHAPATQHVRMGRGALWCPDGSSSVV